MRYCIHQFDPFNSTYQGFEILIHTLYVLGDIPSLKKLTVDFIKETVPLDAVSELLLTIELLFSGISEDSIWFKKALCIIFITWFSESNAALMANALLFVFFVESAINSI